MYITCDGWMFLSLSLKRVSILLVCHKIWKLNVHLVYLLSFVMNFLLSNSLLLQNGSWMPIFVLSSNQWTGIIVSSSLAVGFSKSLITSLTNLAGYPDRMKDCLIACTSSCQLVAIRFALWSAPRIVLPFHLCGMADFQCTCSFPGFWWTLVIKFFPLVG